MCFKVDLGAVVRMLEHMNTADEPSDFRVEHLNCKSNARHIGFNFIGELSNLVGWYPQKVLIDPLISVLTLAGLSKSLDFLLPYMAVKCSFSHDI